MVALNPIYRQYLYVVLIAAMLMMISSHALALPDFSSSASRALSQQQEKVLGQKIMRQVRQNLPLLSDKLSDNYLQNLGNRLVSNTYSDNTMHFFFVDNSKINAFALPGGYIGIHTGLFIATRSESELAGVVAHEIAHVTQHHVARMLEKARQFSIPTMAAVVGSIALATQSPKAGTGAMAATLAGAKQLELNFSRENEQEADRLGMAILAKSGFDPGSIASFFEQMQQSNRFNSAANVPEFLQTHPVTVTRISDARNRAQSYPRHSLQDSLSYQLIKARLSVLTSDNQQQTLALYRDKLTQQDTPANRYAYALTLLRNNQISASKKIAQQLAKKYPSELPFSMLLAEIHLAGKNNQKALAILAKQQQAHPNNHPLIVLYAQTLMQLGHHEQARTLLQQHLRSNTHDPDAFELLSEAAAGAGKIWQAHQARANYLLLNGDFEAAISQFKLAQDDPKIDDFNKAIIHTQLKQAEEEVKRNSKE